jgi:hypothetical protein
MDSPDERLARAWRRAAVFAGIEHRRRADDSLRAEDERLILECERTVAEVRAEIADFDRAYVAYVQRRRADRVVTGARRRPARRESHARRPGHRRTRSTRAGPSDDDGPAEPPAAPRLRLAPKPRVALTFGCLTLDRDLWREVNR